MVYLIRHCGWKIFRKRSGDPVLVARNCIKFQVDNLDPPCDITLIDSFSYFEVHVSVQATQEECVNLFPALLQSVESGISNACVKLRYFSAPKPELLFFCPASIQNSLETSSSAAGQIERHIAHLTTSKTYFACDVHGCPGNSKQLGAEHTIWFRGNDLPADTSTHDLPAGKSTREYIAFQENFDCLVTAVQSCVEEIARKAFAKKMITLCSMEGQRTKCILKEIELVKFWRKFLTELS